MAFDPDAALLHASDVDEQYPHQRRHFPFPFGYPPSTTSGFLRQLDNEDNNNLTTNLTTSNSNSSISRNMDGAGGGGYSPPAWRRLGNGDRSSGFWRKGGDNLLGYGGLPSDLEYDSIDEYDDDDNDDDDDILAAAIRTRLPTGSMSPEKERSPEPEWRGGGGGGGGRFQSPQAQATAGHNHGGGDVRVKSEEPDMDDVKATLAALPPHKDERENCTPRSPVSQLPSSSPLVLSPPSLKPTLGTPLIHLPDIRFALRASVQQRSEPIEALLTTLHSLYHATTSSYAALLLSTLFALLAVAATRALFAPDAHYGGRPVPDLVKVAGIARSFEPLIYYSEHGVAQVGDLQATGVAVWDLGESVRSSNLTSAPIIVRELDELSESLKTLAVELTRFFANVDGDVDGCVSVFLFPFTPLSCHSPTLRPLSSLAKHHTAQHPHSDRLGTPRAVPPAPDVHHAPHLGL